MADLSRVQPHVGTEDKLADHRSSIIPERRNTEAPERQIFADMGNARRGDGGAEQLMRTLGVLNRAADSFQQYADARSARQEADNASRGTVDEAAGHVDPEMMRRSHGYRVAVTRGRTMSAWNAGLRDFDTELTAFIDHQQSPDLEARRQEVRQKLETFYRDFAIDPDTRQFKDFLGSPEARRYLAEQMGQTRGEVEKAALDRIEERFNTEALGHLSTNMWDQARAGKPMNLQEAYKALPPSVSPEATRKTVLLTGMAVADWLKGQGRFEEGQRLVDQLAGAAVAPGQGGSVETIDVPASTAAAEGSADAPAAAAKPTGGRIRVAFENLAAAVMHVESRGKANAVSPAGAMGTMQTMPTTLSDPGYGVRAAKDHSPAELQRVGRDYLRAMLRHFDGNIPLALAAYNAGPGVVDDWLAGTNKTGKNPKQTQLADPRRKGTSDEAFTNAIPFSETRAYVHSVSARAGHPLANDSGDGVRTPEDPVLADGSFRLPDEEADPVERARRAPGPSLLPELTGALALSPQEQAQIAEFREGYSRDVRAEWQRQTRQTQDHTSDSMLLRLYGQGDRLTSQEVTDATRQRLIRPEQAAGLFNLMRQNAERQNAYEDRQQSLEDRRAAKAQEQDADRLIASYVGPVLSGLETPAQARQRLLTEALRIKDPKVQAAVVTTVHTELGRVEDIRQNTPGARGVLDSVQTLTDRQVADIAERAPPASRELWSLRVRNNADLARRRIAQAILNGEDPQKAWEREGTEMNNQFQLLLRTRPRRHR